MTITHKLSELTTMTEQQFKECLERVDVKSFIENPTQALRDVGVHLKEGVTFKFVDSEEEANSLPSNVIPLIHPQENKDALSLDNLDKVAGGLTMADFLNPNKAIEFAQKGGAFMEKLYNALTKPN